MNVNDQNGEIRLQVIVAMLEEFPILKEKLKRYLENPKIKK